jgi:hypothetical protein
MGATANDGIKGRARALGLVCVALLASGLTVLAVRGDVLTGKAPAVTTAAQPCTLPEVAPDHSAVIPDNALTAVYQLLPMLPLPGLGVVRQLDFNQYVTPAQYVHFSSTLLGGRTRSAMEHSGFVRANTTGYEAGLTFFGAEAIQTGSPAQAAELEQRLLTNACEAGVASGLRPLAGIPGGVAFVYHDWDYPPYRANFLVGDTLVRLNVCICEENRGDPYAVLDGWARAVNAHMRAPLG